LRSHGSRKPFTFASLGLTVKNIENLVITQSGNQAPVAQPDLVVTDEETVLTGNLLLDNGSGPDSDPDSGDVISIGAINGDPGLVGTPITLPSGALLTVQSDGSFTFDPRGAFDFVPEGSSSADGIFYTLVDQAGAVSNEVRANFSVTGINDAPVLDPAAFSLDEGETAVGTITASDVDGGASGTLTFSLTANAATDNSLFTIDANIGALSFVVPPDFEDPDDIGGNNVYDVEVQVADDDGGVTTGDFQVTVNNLGEAVLEISGSEPFFIGTTNVGVSIVAVLNVTNVGNETATDIVPGGLSTPWSITNNVVGNTLAPGDSGAIFVSYLSASASASILDEDALEITYDNSVAIDVATRTLQATAVDPFA